MSLEAASLITRPPTEIYGRHTGYGFAGFGVNTAVGNFTQQATDLSFPAGLLGLLNWTGLDHLVQRKLGGNPRARRVAAPHRGLGGPA
jgi:hypothetical protein